jgi:hypothetical protein
MNNTNFYYDWNILYDPFTDLFQMFDASIYRSKQNAFLEKKDNNFRILFTKDSRQPILIEIAKAYEEFGVDFDNMDKKDIIKLVLPRTRKYV